MKSKMIVIDHHWQDAREKICKDGIVPTLTSRMGTGGGNVPLVVEIKEDSPDDCDKGGYEVGTIAYAERSGGGRMDWNFRGIAGTLRAQMCGHPPVVVLREAQGSARKKVPAQGASDTSVSGLHR